MKHQHGGDIYSTSYRLDYSANINPLGTPESVIRAAQESILRAANYPDTRCRELKKGLAQKEGVKEQQIVCGNGAAELIFSLAAAIKPKRALLVSPGFAEYEQALKVCGCKISYYELAEENGFRLGEDYLDYLHGELDVLFLCNPNNPTGLTIGKELLIKIVRRCQSLGIRMVLDSCFVDFLERPQDADMVSFLQDFPCLFILKAFTKIYAMAGLRLGYGLCADEKLMEAMQEAVQPWSVSIPAQAAGTAALGETEYVKRTRALIGEERRWLMDQLNRLGFTVYDASANFIFFRGEKDLTGKCRKQGILIRDCSNYRGLEQGFYRIAVRTHEENEELIRVLGG